MRQRKQIGQALGLVLQELRLEAGLTLEALGFGADTALALKSPPPLEPGKIGAVV